MRISLIIDKISGLPFLPILLTENSKRKIVRVAGVLVYMVWFIPALIVWCVILALLAIPSMIQDA